ncbi:LuxS/MPP-like metallohydrolase [Auricularia subglabra TFB-10046 SS5]|nr:LuxS/MPP-like metallohydrolase [Auricularia subglabra TFB-10046 SS5]
MLATASRTVRATSVRRLATAVEATGFKVAAADRGEPTASITVIAKAGSRYEPAPGLAHVLKNFAFKTTGAKSALRTVREAELSGALLSSTLTREHVILTAEFLRGDEQKFGELLAQNVSSTRFLAHELSEDVLPVVAAEAAEAAATPAVRALDLAHAAAFRSGLGASLFAPEHAEYAAEDVKAFARSAFSAGNVAVVGTGISAETLSHVFQPALKDAAAAPATRASAYFGGENRAAGPAHGLQTLFVGYGTTAPAAEHAVLAALLSPTPAVKWSAGASPLAQALPRGARVESVLFSYSDAALLGFLVQAPRAEDARAAAKAAVDALKAAAAKAPSAEELKGAVARARFRAAFAQDTREGLVAALAPGLLGGPSVSLESTLSALSSVNAAAVSKAAATLTKAKPTFVAVGNLHEIPYPDEIGL